MDIQVLDENPLYHGKTFRLNFKFTENYPIEAPEVMFVRAVDRGTSSPVSPLYYTSLNPFSIYEEKQKPS